MPSFRRRLRGFTWLALFAMLGLALAPTVSHALAHAGAVAGFNPWAEICSAAGAKLNHGVGNAAERPFAQATDPRAAPAKAHAAQHGDCPLCGHAAAAPALPPADPAALQSPAGADFVPTLFAQAPRSLFAWAAAQPRGPPVVS